MFQIVDDIVEDLTFGVSGVKWKFSMESLSDKDEDWESLADSGLLDKKLRNLVRNKSQEQSLTTAMTTETREYPIDPQPAMTFKILKKSPGETSKMALNHQGAASHKNTPKDNRTFEQREEDYMKARMRIFGNSEDGNFGSNETSTTANSTSSPSAHITTSATAAAAATNYPHTTAGGGTGAASSHNSNSSNSISSNTRSNNQNAPPQYFNNRRKKPFDK